VETVRLPQAVEPLAVIDTVVWLEPLAEMVCLGDWGVAVVSRRGARLLRGGPDGLAEFVSVTTSSTNGMLGADGPRLDSSDGSSRRSAGAWRPLGSGYRGRTDGGHSSTW